jgi:hypothetical protein
MADADPYAGAETEEERQIIYQRLLKEYEREEAETEHKQAVYLRDKEIYDSLSKEWQGYRDVQLAENAKFNQYIAMFAAGSFGVSFAFIDKIVPFQSAANKPVLIAAWGLFAITLVLNVLIHLVSSFIHGKYCDIVAENVDRGYEGKPYKPVRRWYSGWVMSALYVIAFLGFLGGMACLVTFVLLNA